MSILVGPDTRLVVTGLTGREGSFHAANNRRYGTNVVAGVTPGKGGQDVDGVPVFDTVHAAVEVTGANTAMVFVPPRFAADSILEAQDAGIELVVAITEGIPAHDLLRVYTHLRRGSTRLIGPNCPGVLSPGKTMGHAGAIVSGSKGTAAAKAEALEARGVRVGRTPTQVSELAAEILGRIPA